MSNRTKVLLKLHAAIQKLSQLAPQKFLLAEDLKLSLEISGSSLKVAIGYDGDPTAIARSNIEDLLLYYNNDTMRRVGLANDLRDRGELNVYLTAEQLTGVTGIELITSMGHAYPIQEESLAGLVALLVASDAYLRLLRSNFT